MRIGSLHDPTCRRSALRALRRADPRLDEAASAIGDPWRPRASSHFATLCGIIISQQLSVQVADGIRRRLRAACGGRIAPDRIAALGDEPLRACGLSRQKAVAVSALAEQVLRGRLRPARLARLPDEEVVARLVVLPGLGHWSAEMFLLFGLGRPDVLAADDLGLREGARRLGRLPGRPAPRELVAMAEPWRPHRSLACLYLWKLAHENG